MKRPIMKGIAVSLPVRNGGVDGRVHRIKEIKETWETMCDHPSRPALADLGPTQASNSLRLALVYSPYHYHAHGQSTFVRPRRRSFLIGGNLARSGPSH